MSATKMTLIACISTAFTLLLAPCPGFSADNSAVNAMAASTPGYTAMFCDASRRVQVRETIGASVFTGVIAGVMLGTWQAKKSADNSAMPVVSGALGGLFGALFGSVLADTGTPDCEYGFNAVMVPWSGGELVAMGVSGKF